MVKVAVVTEAEAREAVARKAVVREVGDRRALGARRGGWQPRSWVAQRQEQHTSKASKAAQEKAHSNRVFEFSHPPPRG